MIGIEAPFTDEQVENLNAFQKSNRYHPFTCGGQCSDSVLVATNAGWICPRCDYTQCWAHEFMTKPIPPDYTADEIAWHEAEMERQSKEGVG